VLHQKIARTDHCVLFDLIRTVHGYVFPKHIFIPDSQPGRFVAVLQILGRLAYNAAREEMIVRPDFGLAGQIDMRANDAARAKFDSLIDDRIRTDSNGAVKPRVRMNDRRRVDHE